MPNPNKNAPAETDDHSLLLRSIQEAGDVARFFFQKEFKTWDKTKGNPVTEVDIEIDRLLRERLMRERPNYGWLSEETEDNPARLNHEKIWIVDPIDGTRAFVKGRPHFTVVGALVDNGRPVSAVILNPITGDLYEARAGKGARLNGNQIQVSNRSELEGCRMLGDGPMFKHPDWTRPWPEMNLETRNSIALRMAMVATGQWDACLTLSHKSDWDIAAGDLIVREAGGLATNHKGHSFNYNERKTTKRSLVVAGPALHAALMDRVGHLDLP